MPLDYSHPGIIRFLKESYDKENEKRVSWFVKNKEKIIKAATLSEKHKVYDTEDVGRALIEPLLPVLSQHHKVSKANRLTKMQIDKPMPIPIRAKLHDKKSTCAVDEIPEAKMKPVEPNVRKILFEVPLGRQTYLNVRNKKAPEERYYSCETSNSVYGWRLGDGERINQSGEYRLYAAIMRDTMSRSGPQTDPKHYGHLLKQHSKCR